MTFRLLLLFLALPLGAQAQSYTYSSLVDFPPQSENGPLFANPVTAMDAQGNLYGTSLEGGAHAQGTVFKVSPAGVLTVLQSFNGTHGSFPAVGVTRDSAGNLYGTAGGGEAGILYKLAPDGSETILYSLRNKPPYGTFPNHGVTFDPKGNLIGYTSFTANDFTNDGGSIYKFTQPNDFAIKFTFPELSGSSNGTGPVGTPLRGKSGVYYGAACCGGIGGSGSVFKFTTSGTLTVLYSFNSTRDGVSSPQGGLVQDAEGNLFGVGRAGIYEITASGVEKDFYLAPFGVHLRPSLLIDSDGNLYGTNDFGGIYEDGALFRVTATGIETDIYSNPGPPLNDGLLMDQAGNIYGSEFAGGANGTGSIFKLTKGNN